MIVFFTGTGNSRHLAQRIAKATGDQIIDAGALIKEHKTPHFTSGTPYVFICPTYAWKIPRIFETLIRQSQFDGNREAYFIMNCGDEIGNATKSLTALCREKDFAFMGVMQINMPENYVALFPVPEDAECKKIISQANLLADDAAEKIKKGEPFPIQTAGILDKLKSGPVNRLFYRFVISAKKFSVTNLCTSCGTCVDVCILNNITLVNGKPKWDKNCTHCMACICRCPVQAIEYGTRTVGKRRYYLEE